MTPRSDDKAAVLLIDDEQIVHDSVIRILNEEGYAVDGVYRVADAIEQLGKQRYDLVLTDLKMPDDSGMKAVEIVARDYPDCGVVMFTGYATVESAVESLKLGALDYLPKPFSPEELAATTAAALNKVFKGRRDTAIQHDFAEAEKAIKSSLELTEVLNLICMSVIRLLQLSGASMYLLRGKEPTAVPATSKGLIDPLVQADRAVAEGPVDAVLHVDTPPVLDPAAGTSWMKLPQEFVEAGLRWGLAVPLKLDGRALGVLRVFGDEPRVLDHDEMDILEKFAHQAARAIDNAMSYDKLRSDVDEMRKYIPPAYAGERE
jgi:ActR/RegA family two-component response regulator